MSGRKSLVVCLIILSWIATLALCGLYFIQRGFHDEMFRVGLHVSAIGPCLALILSSISIYFLFLRKKISLRSATVFAMIGFIMSYGSITEITVNRVSWQIETVHFPFRRSPMMLAQVRDDGEVIPYCYRITAFSVLVKPLQNVSGKAEWHAFRGIWPVRISNGDIDRAFYGFHSCKS